MLKGQVPRQGVRRRFSLGASWSKNPGGGKIQLWGANTGTQGPRRYGGWKRIWTQEFMCWICWALRCVLRQASKRRQVRFLAEPTPAGKVWRNRLPRSISWASVWVSCSSR